MAEQESTSVWKRGLGTIAKLLRERGKSQKTEEDTEFFAGEAVSIEGCTKVAICEDKTLEFFSTLSPIRLFALKGSLIGPLGTYAKKNQTVGHEITITAPIRLLSGEKTSVKVIFSVSSDNFTPGPGKLVRAGEAKQPPNTRIFDVLFTRDTCDCQYTFQLDYNIEVFGFTEVLDKRPVFQTVPPVVQMAAFLRAITRKRRTAFNILENLRNNASDSGVAVIDAIVEASAAGLKLDESQSTVIKDKLGAQDRIVSEQVIQAFALFADIEAGKLTLPSVRLQTELNFSPEAIYLVATHFGLSLDEAAWQDIYQGAAPVSYDAIQESFAASHYEEIAEKFNGQFDRRTPVQILEQLSRETESQRVFLFAKKLSSRFGSGRFSINDQQMALLALLSAVGRRYHGNTVAALCLFVDAEVGFLDEASIDGLDDNVDKLETSTYAMLAVAGAFDVNLRGLFLDVDDKELLENGFARLVELAQVGLLAGFMKLSDKARMWQWIRTADQAHRAMKAPAHEFTRHILGTIPVIDQLSEIDLAHMAESGRDFLASFQSDLDKSLLWCKLNSIPPESFRTFDEEGNQRCNFSFIEGFSAYHFSRSVVGQVQKVQDEDIIGYSNVLAIYLDNRENRHYRFIEHIADASDLEPPENSGWVWSNQIVPELDISAMPDRVRELSQDALLGREAKFVSKYRVLQLVHDAIWHVLTVPMEYQSLSGRLDIFQRVHAKLWSDSGRMVLSGVMDQRTQDILGRQLQQGSKNIDFSPCVYLLEGDAGDEQIEFLGLRMVYEMCRSDLVEFDGYFKQVDEDAFRALLHERLLTLARSQDKKTRILAFHMMAFSDEIPDSSSKVLAQYELTNALEFADDDVAEVISESLVRLCLSDLVPLPNMIKLAARKIELTSSPQMVKPVEVVQPDLPENSSLDIKEVKSLEREVDNWIKDMKLHDEKRFKSLPFVASQGDVDRARLRSFIEFVAALNQSCRDEENFLPRRYFALVFERQLEEVRSSLFESWKLMALSQKRSLAEIIADSTPAEVFLDYRFFVEDHDAELRRELGTAPYLGGQATPLKIYHFPPDEPAGPFRRLESSFVQDRREESHFFTNLMEMYFESSQGRIRILRIKSAGGIKMEEIEDRLHIFETSRTVDLRFAEVLQPHRVRFSPLIHDKAFSIEQVGLGEDNFEDFQALLALLCGQRWQRGSHSVSEQHFNSSSGEHEAVASAPAVPLAPAQPENAPAVAEPIAPIKQAPEAEEVIEDDESGEMSAIQDSNMLSIHRMTELAGSLGRAFNVPPELDRQIVNVLMIAARSSLYDI